MLEELARAVTYPAAPDLRAAVLSRITVAKPLPAKRPGAWGLAAGALAVLVIAFLATLTVSRDARDAVADFLGLAVEGERIEILPTPAGGQTATPFPTPVRLEQIAERVTRAQAVQRAGFEPQSREVARVQLQHRLAGVAEQADERRFEARRKQISDDTNSQPFDGLGGFRTHPRQ